VTGQQREFADVAAAPRDGATHPILHRVEVQAKSPRRRWPFATALSPEDNDPAQLGWLATSLHARLRRYVSFHERNAAFLDHQANLESASATTHPNRRNVGETMLLPFIIFLMILTPVLIPTAVTAAHAIRQFNRPGYAAGYPRTSARLAVAAAA
jgi:hypothetical protein